MSENNIIERIYIKEGCLNDVLTIGAFQIKSPFNDELTVVGEEECTFEVTAQTKTKYSERSTKLEHILERLENINEGRDAKINIVVFPEYCIPAKKVNQIKFFVNRTKIIVIGNYYDENKRSSTTFICLPKGWSDQELYESNKITKSDYDKEVLRDVSQRKILKICWKPNNQEKYGYFQILTCKDFLYFTSIEGIKKYPDCIDIFHAGIFFVPMCTPEIVPFENKASALIREVNIDTGAKSIVSVLCNATDLENHQNGAGICGQTQFVCPSKRYEKIVLTKGFEGCLIAQVNPFKTIVKPTPASESPNAVVYSIVKYMLDIDYNLIPKDIQKREHTGVIINPCIFESLGFKKVYGLMVVNDYKKLKENRNNLPIKYLDASVGIHGIYGYHDILIQSYEQVSDDNDAKRSLALRLWPLIQDEKYFEGNFFGYSMVQKSIKVHGIILDKTNSACNAYSSQIYEKKDQFRRIIRGKKVSSEDLDQLVEMGICIRTPYDLSDRTESEINEKKLEFLVLIEVKSTDEHGSTEDIRQIFKNELLDTIIGDDRIRTVEQIQSSGEAFVRANFILHIVGGIEDLNEILIGKIYGDSNIKFKCKTQVILPAEQMLGNQFPVLLENFVDPFTEKNVIGLMGNCKKFIEPNGFINPFAINMVESEIRERILEIYRFFEEARSKYYISDESFNESNMFKFVYGISDMLSNWINDPQLEDREIIKNFVDNTLSPFILMMSRKIEESLKNVFKKIIEDNKISAEGFNEILNLAVLAKSNKEGHFKYPAISIGTTEYTLGMVEGIIHDEKSVEKFRKVLESKYSEKSTADENINQKVELAEKVCRDLVTIFSQISEESMKITIKNLKGFSKVRNLSSHDDTIDKNELSNIPTYIWGGLKYLIFVNKKIGSSILPEHINR